MIKHPWRSIILVKFHAKAWQNICCDIHRLKTASRFYCALSYLLLLWHSSSKNSKRILLCIVIFTISQNAPTCQSSTGFLNSSNMQPSKNWEEVSVFIHFIRSIFVKPYSLNTKLNTHKTFRRRSEDALNVFWTSLISSIYVLCLGSNPDAHFEQKELYMRTLSKKNYIFFNSESYYRAKI